MRSSVSFSGAMFSSLSWRRGAEMIGSLVEEAQ
jgi:hypothetical protein